MLTREEFEKFWTEELARDHSHPDTILVHKGWGIERIRQVVKSGATLMCDIATYKWIQENL